MKTDRDEKSLHKVCMLICLIMGALVVKGCQYLTGNFQGFL